jgi:pyruvate kinase
MVGLSHNERTLRRMALYWGVVPVPFRQCQQVEEMLDEAMKVLRERHLVEAGQRVVVTAGSAMNVTGSTDLIKVVEV